jgi:apolipoprotein N-acyltransferase
MQRASLTAGVSVLVAEAGKADLAIKPGRPFVWLERMRAWIGGRKGWQAGLICAAAGGLGVFGLAPFHIWPAFAVAITILLIQLDGTRGEVALKRPVFAAFWRAWAFAFGYFFFGLSWVGEAFLVDADKFAILMPFAISLLPAGLGLFWGLAGLIWRMIPVTSALRLLTFAGVFSLAELARSTLLTGFPWNLPAYIWSGGGLISQSAALVGPHGVGLLTLAALALPAVIGARFWMPVSVVLGLVVVSSLGFGAVRLAQPVKTDPGLVIATGQGGFSMKELFDPTNGPMIVQTYLAMLDRPEAQDANVIVWPEGAFPFLLMEQPEVLNAIGERLGDRTLIVGTLRRDMRGSGTTLYNSMIALRNEPVPGKPGLAILAVADKHHLVPFGEYLPFRELFKAIGIDDLVAYEGDLAPARQPSTLAVPGLPLADARVCYEIIFPNFNPEADRKAGWILNVSVDSWYGDGLGPHQHFNQARWRAIETGLPLVRAASGGWSAVVDPYGRSLDVTVNGRRFAVGQLPVPIGR